MNTLYDVGYFCASLFLTGRRLVLPLLVLLNPFGELIMWSAVVIFSGFVFGMFSCFLAVLLFLCLLLVLYIASRITYSGDRSLDV